MFGAKPALGVGDLEALLLGVLLWQHELGTLVLERLLNDMVEPKSMDAQTNAHRAGRHGHLVTVVGAILVLGLAAFVLSACGGGAGKSPRAFEESDLAASVRNSGDASDGLTLVDDESGPQTLAQVAEAWEISPALLRECGFLAAHEAFFEGPAVLSQTAQAILFADAGGASCFLRVLRDLSDAEADADVQAIDARSFGAGALGYSIVLGGFFESSFYIWRNGNLVLDVFAPSEGARAFAEQLDEQAKAIG